MYDTAATDGFKKALPWHFGSAGRAGLLSFFASPPRYFQSTAEPTANGSPVGAGQSTCRQFEGAMRK